MGVCVGWVVINTLGLDHRIPSPALAGKRPRSLPYWPGRSAISLAEVREKRGWRARLRRGIRRRGSSHVSHLPSLQCYLAAGSPCAGAQQTRREPGTQGPPGPSGHAPLLLGRRPRSLVPLPPRRTRPCYLGTQTEGRLPAISSPPPNLSDHLLKKKKKSPYTHSLQSPSPPSAVEGHPTVLTGPGRDAGDRRNGDPPGGDQPGDTRGRAVGSPAPTESGCQSPKCRHLPSGSTRPRERPQGSQSERATRAPAAPAWGPRALLRRPFRGFVYIRARRKPCAGAFITGWPSVLHTREATWAARVATCARGPSGGACASLPPGRTHSTWFPTQGRRCSSRVAPAAARSPRCH